MDSLLVRPGNGPYNRSIMAKFLRNAAIAIAVVLGSSWAMAQTPEPTPSPNGAATGQPAAKKPRKKSGKKKSGKKKGAKKPATTPTTPQ